MVWISRLLNPGTPEGELTFDPGEVVHFMLVFAQGAKTMPMYLARVKLSKEFMGAVVDSPEDRMITTTKLLKGIGGRLHNYFFSFGEYDIILLFELPDNVAAASLSMVLSASSSATKIETTPLLTMQEAVEAMHKSGEAMAVYKLPSGHKRTGKSKAK